MENTFPGFMHQDIGSDLICVYCEFYRFSMEITLILSHCLVQMSCNACTALCRPEKLRGVVFKFRLPHFHRTTAFLMLS